jgi:hypothetical protein
MPERKPKNSNFKTFQQLQPVNISTNRSKQSSFMRQKMNEIHHHKKQQNATAGKYPVMCSFTETGHLRNIVSLSCDEIVKV